MSTPTENAERCRRYYAENSAAILASQKKRHRERMATDADYAKRHREGKARRERERRARLAADPAKIAAKQERERVRLERERAKAAAGEKRKAAAIDRERAKMAKPLPKPVKRSRKTLRQAQAPEPVKVRAPINLDPVSVPVRCVVDAPKPKPWMTAALRKRMKRRALAESFRHTA